MNVARKLTPTWTFADSVQGKRFKKWFSPWNSISLQNEAFRTITVNKWFEVMPPPARFSEEDINKQGSISAALFV